MKFLIWIHLAKASDFQKYKTVTIGHESVFVKTIKHRLNSANRINGDKIREKKAKEPAKSSKLKRSKLTDKELNRLERNNRKRNEKSARRGVLVYDSAKNPPLRGSIEMKAMKSS